MTIRIKHYISKANLKRCIFTCKYRFKTFKNVHKADTKGQTVP